MIMKNKLFKSILLLPALLACACNGASGEINSSSSDDTSILEGNTSSSQEKLYPNSVLTSEWGLEAAKASYDVLGVAIPYIAQDSFIYEIGEDAYGDPDIWFYCFYETDDLAYQAYQDYLGICALKGYSGEETTYHSIDYETLTIIEFQYCVVDRVIGEHNGVELQFVTSTKNGKPCLGIYGMTYLYIDENTYPQLAIDTFFKNPSDVPQITLEDDYSYYFSFIIDDWGNKILEVQILNCYYTVEKEFFDLLLATGHYAIVQYTDDDEDYEEVLTEYEEYMYGFYYYAISNDKIIIFEYDISHAALIIDMYQR